MKKKRLLSGSLAIFLSVAMNINPLATIAGAIYDTGIFEDIATINNNLYLIATGTVKKVLADGPNGSIWEPIPDTYETIHFDSYTEDVESSFISVGCDCPDYSGVLEEIKNNTGNSASNTATIKSDVATIKGYDKDILSTLKNIDKTTQSIDTTTKAILQDTHYIIQQLGYDPTAQTVKPKNVRESFERVSDQLSEITHEYRVANIHSLNAEFGGSLWNPKSEDVPNLKEYCEITGGFAQTYLGYWDTAVSTVNDGTLPETQALRILGQDAIIRSEGIVPVALSTSKNYGKGADLTSTVFVVSADNVIGASGRSNAMELVDTDETGTEDVTYNDWGQITDSYDISDKIPTSEVLMLTQSIIPSENITWLDAVTVLYKALGDDQITLSGIYSRDPDITPESSPLSQNLSGISDYWQGYNYYVFATRTNPTYAVINGSSVETRTDYVYWEKAVKDGFVNYLNRGETINCIEFYALARQMMEAYGEPVITDNEIQTLLQVYGSYYPVQMGDKASKSWAFLKARGILTEDNMPKNYTDNITRAQLIDICARIKDPNYRETFKDINLSISLDELVVDKGYYPYYNFEISLEEDATYEHMIDYTSAQYYTYLFPMQADVNLGYGGTAVVYTEPDKTGPVFQNFIYNGMVHLDDDTGGHYFYVLQLPKGLEEPLYLSFVDLDDPDKKYGSVDFIELNSEYMTGGIFTQYVVSEKDGYTIATLADAEYGVNYYSFVDFPNNMDLIYYVDELRQSLTYSDENKEQASIKKTRYTKPTTIDGPIESMVAFYNKITTPLKAYAIAGDLSDPNIRKATVDTHAKWTIMYPKNVNTQDGVGVYAARKYDTGSVEEDALDVSSYLEKIAGFNSTTNGPIYFYTDDNNKELERVKSNAGLLYVARCALVSDWDYPNWGDATSIPGVANSGTKIGNVVNRMQYADILSSANPKNSDFNNLDFISLYALGINGLDTAPNGTVNEKLHDNDVMTGLQSQVKSSLDSKITASIASVYITDPYMQVSPLKVDGAVVDTNDVKGKAITSVKGNQKAVQIFCSKLEELLNDKGAGSLNAAESMSGIHSGATDTDLSTSVIMGKDRIYIAWNDMVKYGIAKSTAANGLPMVRDSDGVYSFYTNQGVVRINETEHIVQVGTTVYAFRDDNTENIPKLVVTDKNGNLYFDSIAITGVVNKDGYTLDAGKAKKQNGEILGDASYQVLQISSVGVQNASSHQTEMNMYTLGDAPKVNSGSVVSSRSEKCYLIDWTSYDGSENAGETFTYWEDCKDKARISLTNTLPVANWIVTCTKENSEIKGKLYVFYLKEVFENGFDDSGGKSKDCKPEPSGEWETYWDTELATALERASLNFPDTLSDFQKSYDAVYGSELDAWYMHMNEYAYTSLFADTGKFYGSANFVCRCFDITTSSPSNCTLSTDLREFTSADDPLDESIGNEAGACYFLDFLGFVYNVPSVEDFTLSDYYYGKYPLPIAYDNEKQYFVNYNLNYYIEDPFGTQLPIGWDLTVDGYLHYSDYTKDKSHMAYEYRMEYKYDSKASSQSGPFTEIIQAPVGLYAKYGLFDDSTQDYKISEINQSYTKSNIFYFGSRISSISSLINSTDTRIRYWQIGSESFVPFSISANTTAYLINMRKLSNSNYNTYLVDTNDIGKYAVENTSLAREDLATPEIDWNGKSKLLYILNIIDQGTSWWIWICLTLAPLICIIIMTLLIGMSFLTESQIWNKFCEKVFDPVKLLTFGARDSTNWNWRTVLVPCIITYIAFALFCNANIIRIIVYVVDGIMRILSTM